MLPKTIKAHLKDPIERASKEIVDHIREDIENAILNSPVVMQVKVGFLPIPLVLKVYGVSRSFLYKLKYERKLFHYKVGDKTFIKISELEELIEKGKK